jgi:hypothetical protein
MMHGEKVGKPPACPFEEAVHDLLVADPPALSIDDGQGVLGFQTHHSVLHGLLTTSLPAVKEEILTASRKGFPDHVVTGTQKKVAVTPHFSQVGPVGGPFAGSLLRR